MPRLRRVCPGCLVVFIGDDCVRRWADHTWDCADAIAYARRKHGDQAVDVLLASRAART